MNTLRFSAAINVDKGLVRDNNEDNFYFNGKFLDAASRDISTALVSVPSEHMQMYGVFDGMGGEAMGEEASLIAAQSMAECRKDAVNGKCDVKDIIPNAIAKANDKICSMILENQKKRSGSTLAAVIIDNDRATVFNVGDSRVYLLHDGKFTQISEDDTFVQRLISLDVITPEEAKTHPDRHKLTQHLGMFPDEMVLEPHRSEEIELHEGDKLLLCSDGLFDIVSEDTILEILSSDTNCTDITARLTEAALAGGGGDNVTTIVICAESPAQNPTVNARIWMIPLIIAILCATGILLYSMIHSSLNPQDAGVSGYETVLIYGLPDTLEMTVGEVRPLAFSVTPTEKISEVTFTTDNQAVAEVFEDGMIEARKKGTANIRISAPGYEKTVSITVTENIP